MFVSFFLSLHRCLPPPPPPSSKQPWLALLQPNPVLVRIVFDQPFVLFRRWLRHCLFGWPPRLRAPLSYPEPSGPPPLPNTQPHGATAALLAATLTGTLAAPIAGSLIVLSFPSSLLATPPTSSKQPWSALSQQASTASSSASSPPHRPRCRPLDRNLAASHRWRPRRTERCPPQRTH